MNQVLNPACQLEFANPSEAEQALMRAGLSSRCCSDTAPVGVHCGRVGSDTGVPLMTCRWGEH